MEVVRIRRQNGMVVQGCDVYIGRACNQGGWNLPLSKWYNPFTIKACGNAQEACRRYDIYLRNSPHLIQDLPELKGKVLGCWCTHSSGRTEIPICHGQVIINLMHDLGLQY